MKSNFSRPLRFHSWTSSNWTQKKVTETKVEKIPNGTLKMAFFTPWFLGFTTIIIKYQLFIRLGIGCYEQISKKKKAKIYHGDCRISQTGRFWWPLFDSNFHTVNVIFGWNQLYQKNFTFLGMRWAKILQLSFDGFDTRKKRFCLVSDFFRAKLYLTKVSPRELKYGSVEAEWSMDIIKWP